MRRSAPSALRNRAPIADVLREWLPTEGDVLELASGTGEHVVFFAKRFPGLRWHPADIDPRAIESIRAWTGHSGVTNLDEPLMLDASAEWPDLSLAAVLCINMAHISPWQATLGLLRNAARQLRPDGSLIFYGPWFEEGQDPVPSNVAFDAELRSRNPQWGIRTIEELRAAAAQQSLDLFDRRDMPANNFMLRFRRVPERR